MWWRRLEALDWLAIALLVVGGAFVATGLLPLDAAEATGRRVGPLLIFLLAVIVLAELAAHAEVFDVIATRLTILARGRNAALFGLCVAFATLTTVFLNLDTTAVLLTPVVLTTAARSGIPPLPLAMTTVWLANTASLLLPVSNLTNLLAMNRVGLTTLGFAGRMALPALAAVLVVGACLWVFYWRRNPPRYVPPESTRPRDRRLFVAGSVACTVFVIGIVTGVSIYLMAVICAVIAAGAFAVWDRGRLVWSLLPWRLIIFVTGLFLVIDTLGRHGLSTWMTGLIGTDGGTEGATRAAAAGGVLSNLLNNLPTYLAGEAVIPTANHTQLLALLIGTNVGPLVTPWGSLATLLWAERCRAADVTVKWGRFALTGLVTATLTLVVSVAALLVS